MYFPVQEEVCVAKIDHIQVDEDFHSSNFFYQPFPS